MSLGHSLPWRKIVASDAAALPPAAGRSPMFRQWNILPAAGWKRRRNCWLKSPKSASPKPPLPAVFSPANTSPPCFANGSAILRANGVAKQRAYNNNRTYNICQMAFNGPGRPSHTLRVFGLAGNQTVGFYGGKYFLVSLLEVKNLKVHFPVKSGWFSRVRESVKAVDDVSFRLAPGETGRANCLLDSKRKFRRYDGLHGGETNGFAGEKNRRVGQRQ